METHKIGKATTRLCPKNHEMNIIKITNYFPLCDDCKKLLLKQCFSCELCNIILCFNCYKKLPISYLRLNAQSKYLQYTQNISPQHAACKAQEIKPNPDLTFHSINEFIWQKIENQAPLKYLTDGSQHIKHLQNYLLSIFYNLKSGTFPIDEDLIKALKYNKQILRERIPLNQYRVRIKQLVEAYIISKGIDNILVLGTFIKLASLYNLSERIFLPCKSLAEYYQNQELIDYRVQQLADLARRKEEKNNKKKFCQSFSVNRSFSFYPTASIKYKHLNLSQTNLYNQV